MFGSVNGRPLIANQIVAELGWTKPDPFFVKERNGKNFRKLFSSDIQFHQLCYEKGPLRGFDFSDSKKFNLENKMVIARMECKIHAVEDCVDDFQ
ncbi:hypothetical protein AVEN_159553-1 [Araneus ventricosus]|uniref:Uncharacterized protein n=1 Tax=Araneus ventricosus TaxID=182803 RepID=A0A4Y2G1A6_ARAVE|nr:hypothetical protein AVEN_159553-1 [Araneus ventricosus]